MIEIALNLQVHLERIVTFTNTENITVPFGKGICVVIHSSVFSINYSFLPLIVLT